MVGWVWWGGVWWGGKGRVMCDMMEWGRVG